MKTQVFSKVNNGGFQGVDDLLSNSSEEGAQDDSPTRPWTSPPQA